MIIDQECLQVHSCITSDLAAAVGDGVKNFDDT